MIDEAEDIYLEYYELDNLLTELSKDFNVMRLQLESTWKTHNKVSDSVR